MVKLTDYLHAPEEWNQVAKSKNFEHSLNVSGEHIENQNFDGFDFSRVNFAGCNFENCNFSKAKFSNTQTTSGSNNGSTFIKCDFSGLHLTGNQLIMQWTTFKECIFENNHFINTHMQNSNFFGCIWSHSKLEGAHFEKSSFLGSDFSDTKFRFCSFLDTMWQDVQIGTKTSFEYCVFSPKNATREHDVLNDKSETVAIKSPYKYWNWKLISKIGRVPALEFSWTLFGIGLFILSGLIFLNDSQFVQTINYPIQIPWQLQLFTLGAFLTSIGTFCFRAGCPDRIQNFTENEWVEGHGHPRIFYREYCVKNIGWLYATTIFLSLGLAILGWLIVQRMYYVLSNIF